MRLFNRSKSLQEIKNMRTSAATLQDDLEKFAKSLNKIKVTETGEIINETDKSNIYRQLLQMDQSLVLLGEYKRILENKLLPKK